MAGDGVGFPAKCLRYGSFMHHLRREQAEGLFWALFGFVLILLIVAGLAWTSSEGIVKKIKQAELDLEKRVARKDLRQKQKDLKKRQYMTVAITSVCALLGTVATIMEAFAALTLQYCDGEDLMQFYWSFWALLQVGSVIALIGLAVYHLYSLNDKDHPPWMIALGTPVLVIAGLGHIAVLGFRAVWRRLRACRATQLQQPSCRGESTSMTPSRSNTYGASILAFNNMGEVIIFFPNSNDRPAPPQGAELIRFDPVSGGAIVRYPPPRVVPISSETTPQNISFENQINKRQASIQEQQPSPPSSSVAGAQGLYKAS